MEPLCGAHHTARMGWYRAQASLRDGPKWCRSCRTTLFERWNQDTVLTRRRAAPACPAAVQLQLTASNPPSRGSVPLVRAGGCRSTGGPADHVPSKWTRPACLWGRRSWRVVEGGIQWQGASGWDEPYKAGGRRGFGSHFGGGVVRRELPTSRSGGGHGWVSGWPNPTTARTDVTRQPDLARGQDLEAAVRCHLTAPSFDSSFRRGRLARSGHGRHHAETLRCKVPWTARAEDSTRLLRHQAGTSGNR